MDGWTFWADYWWLIFPIMGFAFAGFGMWMNYKRHKDTLELLKTYAAQGKDPQELAKLLAASQTTGNDWNRWAPPSCYGPLREWRRTVMFFALSAGFGIAAYTGALPGSEAAFYFVSIILGVMAVASLVFALLSTALMNKQKNDG